MAKNNGFFTITPSLISQLIFGGFLIFILIVSGSPVSLSIFLGLIGGFTLGWFTTAGKNSPQSPTVASADGIDAGLRYWLFFLVGFYTLGYSAPMSILLGAIGALGGGWIIAWWGSKEETRTQFTVETTQEVEGEESNDRITKQQRRRPTRRYRRSSGGINFRFWQR